MIKGEDPGVDSFFSHVRSFMSGAGYFLLLGLVLLLAEWVILCIGDDDFDSKIIGISYLNLFSLSRRIRRSPSPKELLAEVYKPLAIFLYIFLFWRWFFFTGSLFLGSLPENRWISYLVFAFFFTASQTFFYPQVLSRLRGRAKKALSFGETVFEDDNKKFLVDKMEAMNKTVPKRLRSFLKENEISVHQGDCRSAVNLFMDNHFPGRRRRCSDRERLILERELDRF